MHTGDLGVLPYLHASTIVDMIGCGVDVGCIVTGNKAARIEVAWQMIQTEYELCGTEKRMSIITARMIGSGKNENAYISDTQCKISRISSFVDANATSYAETYVVNAAKQTPHSCIRMPCGIV